MDNSTTYAEKKSQNWLLYIFVIILVLTGLGIGAYLYNNQHKKILSATKQVNVLNSQLQSLNNQLISVKAASNVSISNWKSYCDPYSSDFCFKYPASWTVTDSSDSQNKYAQATVTNPGKTLTLTYTNPYIKDDFPANFIAHSASAINVGGNNLTVLGGYYVEAVDHTPIYAITNTPVSSAKQGQNITVGVVPTFQYDKKSQDAEISITSTNQNYTSTQQADAWFNSVNGKAALAIMQSLSAK